MAGLSHGPPFLPNRAHHIANHTILQGASDMALLNPGVKKCGRKSVKRPGRGRSDEEGILLVARKRGPFMYLESAIWVNRPLSEVWAFFADPSNLVKWDRSVARVVITNSVPVGVGFTFDTFGPATNREGARSSYRMSEYHPGEYVWVDLTNAKWFSQARWLTAFEATGKGTKVRIGITLTFKPRYIYLWPIFRLTTHGIKRDLGYLKRAIESQ